MQQSDKEYYNEFLKIRDQYLSSGWKEVFIKRDREFVDATYTKNGYAIHVLFGCEEKVKQEVL